MIFVTSGTQLSFPRMVGDVINALTEIGYNKSVVFQDVDKYSLESLYPDNKWSFISVVDSATYNEYFANADLVISHAGMGSVIKALEEKVKLIIYPRNAKRKEHRNNHQIDTCNSIIDRYDSVKVANNLKELVLAYSDLSDIKFDDSWMKSREEFIDNFYDVLKESFL